MIIQYCWLVDPYMYAGVYVLHCYFLWAQHVLFSDGLHWLILCLLYRPVGHHYKGVNQEVHGYPGYRGAETILLTIDTIV